MLVVAGAGGSGGRDAATLLLTADVVGWWRVGRVAWPILKRGGASSDPVRERMALVGVGGVTEVRMQYGNPAFAPVAPFSQLVALLLASDPYSELESNRLNC